MSGASLLLHTAPGAINQALADSESAVTVTIQFQNDGDYLYDPAGSQEWVVPSTAEVAAKFDLQVNVTAGAIDSGTVDTWLSLETTRTYVKSVPGTATLRVRIREKLTGMVYTDQEVVLTNT